MQGLSYDTRCNWNESPVGEDGSTDGSDAIQEYTV